MDTLILKKEIIKYIRENLDDPDTNLSFFNLAIKFKIPPGIIKKVIFSLLKDLIKFHDSVGKHNDIPDEEFDPDQLRMGIKVEREHTDDDRIAKKIAKDHLSELKDYYTRLEKMEEEGKREIGIEDDEEESEKKEIIEMIFYN